MVIDAGVEVKNIDGIIAVHGHLVAHSKSIQAQKLQRAKTRLALNVKKIRTMMKVGVLKKGGAGAAGIFGAPKQKAQIVLDKSVVNQDSTPLEVDKHLKLLEIVLSKRDAHFVTG
jgi:hypothetical protein